MVNQKFTSGCSTLFKMVPKDVLSLIRGTSQRNQPTAANNTVQRVLSLFNQSNKAIEYEFKNIAFAIQQIGSTMLTYKTTPHYFNMSVITPESASEDYLVIENGITKTSGGIMGWLDRISTHKEIRRDIRNFMNGCDLTLQVGLKICEDDMKTSSETFRYLLNRTKPSIYTLEEITMFGQSRQGKTIAKDLILTGQKCSDWSEYLPKLNGRSHSYLRVALARLEEGLGKQREKISLDSHATSTFKDNQKSEFDDKLLFQKGLTRYERIDFEAGKITCHHLAFNTPGMYEWIFKTIQPRSWENTLESVLGPCPTVEEIQSESQN